MSEPIKHHFVPETYLKRFSYDKFGNLYTLSIKSKYTSKVKSKNKSQICYNPNRYKFYNDEIIKQNNITDLNTIEKSSFDYEEKELTVLFNKIDSNQYILKNELVRIIQIIVDIKSRNPSMSENFVNEDIDYNQIKEKMSEVRNKAKLFCEMNGYNIDLVKKAEKKATKKFDDKNYKYNLYLESFIQTNEVKEDLINLLSNWITIIYTSNLDNPFITSDNPGFSFDKNNNNLMNTSFSYADAFAIPISPKSLLCFLKPNKDNYKGGIIYKKATKEIISFFNNSISKTCNKLIVSNSKNQLKSILNYRNQNS